MYGSRTRPEILAICGVILVIAALWGAWFVKTPGLMPF
jgi:hypothetical protein